MTREDPAAFAPPPAFGPFRVLHQIGVGALGPVFRTYEPTRDRLIAVKVFRLDITPEQAEALADELSRAADAGLFHPSIVEPVAAGVEGTVAYRAEEYVAAESLDVAIRHYAPASLDNALPFITQLAGAIDFARAAGIGHGALHLRDVFVTPDEARASGFGVVEALERVGLRAPVRRPYSAPERIAGAAWSTPADVFSLAAISYELLTARRPAGLGDQVGPVSGANVGVYAEAMRRVLARAMDEDPSARYPSALAFASALEAAARGEQVTDAVAQVGAIAGATAATASPPIVDVEPEPEPIEPEPEPIEPESVEPEPEPEELSEPREPREPEQFWDIEDERHADEGHAILTREEADDIRRQEEAEPSFFDEEAIEDLALDVPGEQSRARFADDFADERETTVREYIAPVVTPIENVDRLDADVPPARAAEPPRTAMLPLAVTLIIGLLVGFAAGYSVGTRDGAAPPIATSETAVETPQPGAAQRAQRGKEWSEQAVKPPVAPPPVPQETPTPTAPPQTKPGASAPATGRIVIRSTPSRAGVTVNGVWRGRTPLTLDRQRFGAYEIRIVQPGFAVASEDLTLSAEEPQRTLDVRLQRGRSTETPPRTAPAPVPPAAQQPQGSTKFTGMVYVDSRPRGARVFIDGKEVGTTPMRVPEVAIGAHVVRLELDDHRTWTTSARVAAGQETRVTGSLERIR